MKVGVAQQDINLIWTLLAGGSCVATVLTGFVFKRSDIKRWLTMFYNVVQCTVKYSGKCILSLQNNPSNIAYMTAKGSSRIRT